MTKLYTVLRIIAYIAGLIGMVLFVTAQQSAEPHSLRAVVGASLLIVSFGCFLGTYVVFLAIRLNRHRK